MNVSDQFIVFRPHFNVQVVDQERVVLISEKSQFLLSGALYVAIAQKLLAGSHSVYQLHTSLQTYFDQNKITEALTRMSNKSFISIESKKFSKEFQAFWSELGIDPLQLENKLKNACVTIRNFSSFPTDSLELAFEQLNLTLQDDGNFFVVVVNDYVCEELKTFFQHAKQKQIEWILVKPSGNSFWIGPIFSDHKEYCWNCFISGINQNRPTTTGIGFLNKNVNQSFLDTVASTAFNMAAVQIAKWILIEDTNDRNFLSDKIMSLNIVSAELKFHRCEGLITCPKCWTDLDQVNKYKLASCEKKYLEDGSERACSLEETLLNLQCIESPITGIVTNSWNRIVNSQYIVYAVRNHHEHNETNIKGRNIFTPPDVVVGKGITEIQARVACFAEAVERCNSTNFGISHLRCSWNAIRENALHPEQLLLFSETQYRNRNRINEKVGNFNRVPNKYDGREIGWTKVISLWDESEIYVPTSYCYLNYSVSNEISICPGNTNGCASGNSVEEAIFYALLELIERDSVALWWYNRVSRPEIDLDNIESSYIHKTRKTLHQSGRTMHVIDITSDLKVPCFAAVSWNEKGKKICVGTAAHLNPDVAISHAIAELNQVLTRDNMPDEVDFLRINANEHDLVKWLLKEKIDSHKFLVPATKVIKSKKTRPHKCSNDFLDDINFIVNILKSNNLNSYWLNQSHLKLKFYTVRVIVPHLRHFWNRLAKGRLYDVPVNLGWLNGSRSEQEMNPIPYFL